MPFVPIYDRNTLQFIPFQIVTVGIIALCVLVYAATAFLGRGTVIDVDIRVVQGLVFIPAALSGGAGPAEGAGAWLALFTYAFVHGGPLHLIGNLFFLWVFGDNVEDRMGHVRFLLFFLLASAAGAIGHWLTVPASPVPLVGASGGISGILAAYLLLFPKVRLWGLLFGRIPIRLPAFLFIGGWLVMQVAMLFATLGAGTGVSWAAHVGGFVAGAALTPLLVRRVPALQQARQTAKPSSGDRRSGTVTHRRRERQGSVPTVVRRRRDR